VAWCQANGFADPLAVDLDGDGVHTTPISAAAPLLDLNGKGLLVFSAWLDTNDGWIVHDANGDGAVDIYTELLGTYRIDGFDELASFDTNADGAVDAADAGYGQLSVWRDANASRTVDAGEMVSLAGAGVSSLDRGVVNRPTVNVQSRIDRHATAIVNGAQRHLADVELAFQYSLAN